MFALRRRMTIKTPILNSVTIALSSLFLVLFNIQIHAAPKGKVLIVRYPSSLTPGDTRADYDRAIVDLLLQKTQEKYGPYELIGSVRMQQSRALVSLKDNQLVDVVPTTSSIERERDLLPIRHDIHKGLMGVKMFLVRKADLPKYAGITKIEELQKFTVGQGHDWPDASVFKDAGFKVMTSPTYEGLFKMLSTDRFDIFPRSLPEIWDEERTHSSENLVVEPHLAVVYRVPAYIFVNKKNTELAKRLEEGFEIALKDGSFDKLFMAKHGANIEKAKIKTRKVFYIENPVLPPEYKGSKPDLGFLFQ